MRIDLHTHSSCSDGTTPAAELPAMAKHAGLDVVALTDHDTLAGLVPAGLAAAEAGIDLVPGVEMSCLLGNVEVHLLGYFVDPAHEPLTQALTRVRTDRSRRAELMVDRCRAAGADITIEQVRAIAGDGAIGRPHIAAALVAAGVVADSAAAFSDRWIGDGGRADVPKHVLTVEHAIELVLAAGGAAVLAHPRSARRRSVVGDAALAKLAGAGLSGVEVDHPEHDTATRSWLRSLAANLGLLATGSSDFHGDRKPTRLGECTTDPEIFVALREASTRPDSGWSSP